MTSYHSVSTGMLAEMLARAEGIHQHQVFTASVLHKIGVMALDQVRVRT
jgi:HD-like signal output (HDOD) protein